MAQQLRQRMPAGCRGAAGLASARLSIFSAIVLLGSTRQQVHSSLTGTWCPGTGLAHGDACSEAACIPALRGMQLPPPILSSAKQAVHVGGPDEPLCIRYDPHGEPPRGEICVRGPAVFTGYYQDKKKTEESFGECLRSLSVRHEGHTCYRLTTGCLRLPAAAPLALQGPEQSRRCHLQQPAQTLHRQQEAVGAFSVGSASARCLEVSRHKLAAPPDWAARSISHLTAVLQHMQSDIFCLCQAQA